MMRILFISDTEPALNGAVVRLLYDILCAYNNHDETIHFAVVGKDDIQISLPDHFKFIKWSRLSNKRGADNPAFGIPKVKWAWTKYRKLHVNASEYDGIICYPYHCVAFDYQGYQNDFETIAVDSATMVFTRAFLHHQSLIWKILSGIRLIQTKRLDQICSCKSKGIYTVGQSDAEAYNVFFNKGATYIPHTVNEDIIAYREKNIWDGKEKLKLCFAGSLQYFYSGKLYKQLINALCQSGLQYRAEVSFLGQIQFANKLKMAGFSVKTDTFVPSFEEYLLDKHILMAPLLVGGGTKNRILTALAVGMDVIGTPVAVENIYGIEACHIANTPEMFIERIRGRLDAGKIYNYSTDKMEEFLHFHGKQNWTEQFWDKVFDGRLKTMDRSHFE